MTPPKHNELADQEPSEPLAEIGAAPGATAPQNESQEESDPDAR